MHGFMNTVSELGADKESAALRRFRVKRLLRWSVLEKRSCVLPASKTSFRACGTVPSIPDKVIIAYPVEAKRAPASHPFSSLRRDNLCR